MHIINQRFRRYHLSELAADSLLCQWSRSFHPFLRGGLNYALWLHRPLSVDPSIADDFISVIPVNFHLGRETLNLTNKPKPGLKIQLWELNVYA